MRCVCQKHHKLNGNEASPDTESGMSRSKALTQCQRQDIVSSIVGREKKLENGTKYICAQAGRRIRIFK